MTGPLLSLPRRHRRGLASVATAEQARRRAEKIRKALWEDVVVGVREGATA